MPLIEQSPLWILPAVPLALLMTHAMMLSIMSFLAKPPLPNRKPVTGDKLKRRLSSLNAAGGKFRLSPARAHDYNVEWDIVEPSWYDRYAAVWYSDMYRLRLLVDEARHEVRTYESISSFYFMWGFAGWSLLILGGVTFIAGPLDLSRWRGKAYGMTRVFPPKVGEVRKFDLDTKEARRAIEKVIRSSGWSVRPVVLWFEVKRSALTVGRALLPPPLRWWPAKRLWLTLHPASYLATVGWLLFVAGGYDLGAIVFVLVFTAVWFGFWGLFLWALIAGLKPRRRKARRRQRRYESTSGGGTPHGE
jgi:hypothetical protein